MWIQANGAGATRARQGKVVGDDLTERERELLTLVRDTGPITRSTLIKTSGLSGPAVFRATEDLAQKGYLLIGSTVAAGRGQPSHEVRLNPDAAFTLGIAVMTDFAEAAIMDAAGSLRAVRNVTAPGMARDAILANTRRLLDEEIAKGLPADRMAGVGLALAGYFVGEADILNPAAELDDWALTDLRSPIERMFGAPALIENSANAAAVAESLLGVGRTAPTFAYINFASGFGGGVILNRRLWRGLNGNAGEWAAVLDAVNAFVPNLETLRTAVSAHGQTTRGIDELVACVALDWPGVEDWIGKAAKSIRLLTLIISESIDVGTIVLGGRLPREIAERLAAASTISQADLDRVKRRGRGRPAPRIIAAELPPRGVAIGASVLPLASRIFRST